MRKGSSRGVRARKAAPTRSGAAALQKAETRLHDGEIEGVVHVERLRGGVLRKDVRRACRPLANGSRLVAPIDGGRTVGSVDCCGGLRAAVPTAAVPGATLRGKLL